MNELLTFNKMMTPKLITVIYWLALIAVVISGVSSIFMNFGIGSLIRGVLIVVLGGIGVRVWCELLIVVFKMNDALQDIRNK